ncbi:MAG: hypothetical protein O3A80_03105 [bacterium]|nr:hypothetical protein [bacterium]
MRLVNTALNIDDADSYCTELSDAELLVIEKALLHCYQTRLRRILNLTGREGCATKLISKIRYGITGTMPAGFEKYEDRLLKLSQISMAVQSTIMRRGLFVDRALYNSDDELLG